MAGTQLRAIVRAVRNMHGNPAQAARSLGISRSTLYRKVERYHLEDIARLGDDVQRPRGNHVTKCCALGVSRRTQAALAAARMGRAAAPAEPH